MKHKYLFALALILYHNILLSFCCSNRSRIISWELRWVAKGLNLTLQLISTCFDRHTRAVEAKWEQYFLSLHSLEPNSILQKRETKRSVKPNTVKKGKFKKGKKNLPRIWIRKTCAPNAACRSCRGREK